MSLFDDWPRLPFDRPDLALAKSPGLCRNYFIEIFSPRHNSIKLLFQINPVNIKSEIISKYFHSFPLVNHYSLERGQNLPAQVQSLPIKIISSKINDGTLYEETRKHTAQLLNGKYFSFKNRILIHLNLFLLFIISVKLKLDTRYGTIKVKSWVTKDLLLDPFI